MIAILIVLIFVILVIGALRMYPYRDYYDDEVVEETTTTTTIETAGTLLSWISAAGRRCVTDPADRDVVVVAPTDDMYEDGAGRIWLLA